MQAIFRENREMRIQLKLARILLTVALVTSFAGCAGQTIYRGTPAASLSDEQLVEELVSAVQGLGVAINRTQYLMAVRPEPAYVLTSSTTTFSGALNARYNAYTMPIGYGASTYGSVYGASSTQYHYTDVNAGARLGNAIATAITQARETAYRKRGQEVWAEFQRRAETRRAQTEQLIQEFFSAYPSLQSRRLLVAAVAPWAAAEGYTDSRQTLEPSREIIEGLSRGPGLSGTWYGLLSQTTRTDRDQEVAFNQFIRIALVEDDGKLVGKGQLGSGEVIELNGRVNGQQIAGAIANTTSAINVSSAGIAASSQITAEYAGSGAGQRLTGTVVFLR